MKKLFFLLSLVFSITFILSCDDNSENFETNEEFNQIKVNSYFNSNNKSGNVQILEFSDMESFRNKVLELDNELKKQDDDFVNKYGHLDEEAINQMDSIIGFNYYKPLLDFNRSLGFNSLIDDYINTENYWLSQEVLKMELDPDVKFRFLKESELALLNDDWSVKIGGKIYVHKFDGKMEITSGSYNTLVSIAPYEKISEINLTNYNDLNVQINTVNNTQNCTNQYIQNVNYYNVDGNSKRQMKCKIRMTNNDFWTGTELYVKTKSLKKSLGIWWAWRTNIKAGLKGGFQINSVYGAMDNCVNTDFCNENINQTSSSSSSSVNYSIALNPNLYFIRVSKQGLQGVHKSNGTLRYQYFYQ